MRKPALLSLLLIAAFALGPTASASAATLVVAPEFANSFPTLQPLESTTQESSQSGGFGPDELLLLAATYWLLLATFAIRRKGHSLPAEDPVPITGWVLGYAPPLPR